MIYYSAFCEKPTPPSYHRAKRDRVAVRKAMPDAGVTDQRLDHFPTNPDRRSSVIDVLARIALATSKKNDPSGAFA